MRGRRGMRRAAITVLAVVGVLAVVAAPSTGAKSVKKAKHPKIAALTVSLTGKHIKMSALVSPNGGQTTYGIYIYELPEKCLATRKFGKCNPVEEGIAPAGEGTVTAGAEPREVHAASEGEPSREHPWIVQVIANNEAGTTVKSKNLR